MAGKLKDLSFDDVSAQVLSTNPGRVLITWRLKKTAQDLRNLKFFVDRGESPEEYSQLNAEGIAANSTSEFVDYSPNLLDLHKVYYYRVRAVEFTGVTPVQTFTSPNTTRDGDLDLVGIYVVDEHLFLHRWVAGVPTVIFKRRRDGTYCPDCWDEILKRVTRSNCQTCYGTGKLAGFYPPYEAWMNFEPDPKQFQVADWGVRQPSQTDIQFTNYPLLSDGDVIVELKTNKLWKVAGVRYPQKNRTIMLQIARLDAVNPTDIEYKVPVDQDRRRALVKELEAREREREF